MSSSNESGLGNREPARPLMTLLSERLGFAHHTCSCGGTVEHAFLADLASALGVEDVHSKTKRELIDAAHEVVHDAPLPDAQWSRGSTVTNEALQAILDGVQAKGWSAPSGAAAARASKVHHELGLDAANDPFDPRGLSDERRQALRTVTVREGQPAFRRQVLAAYGQRCAISGCDVAEALEAAHITPYRGVRTDTVANGLCLRADLHRLWDVGLLAVDEESHEVLVSSQPAGQHYLAMKGVQIALPAEPELRPSPVALRQQREWCGL